jgi:hypothetical protein
MTRPTDEQAAREMEQSRDPKEAEIARQWLLGNEAKRRSILTNHFATFEAYRRVVHYRGMAEDLARQQ